MTLKQLNKPARSGISLFAVTVLMGLAYAVLAISMSITGGDELIPSLAKVKDKYAGIMIVSAMRGSMYEHVSDDDSIDLVEKWVRDGAPRDQYDEQIAEIMDEDCTDCHSRTSTMTDAKNDLPLTSYEDVLAVTVRGQPWAKLAVQTHTHLFGIGTLTLILSLLMAHTAVFAWVRQILIALGFIGLWGDALSWTLAKYVEAIGYAVPFTGALLIGALTGMAVIILVDCWMRVPLVGQPAD